MMQRVCILDFETTGVDASKALPLEIGAIICECSEAEPWKITRQFNAFFKRPELSELPPGIEELTGINLHTLQTVGRDSVEIAQMFGDFINGVELFMAHNMHYDYTVLMEWLDFVLPKYHLHSPITSAKNWICSINDVPYPTKYRCKILSHLAFDHGVVVQENETLHSAVGDIKLLARLLEKGGYTLDKILTYRNEPWLYLRAIVSPPWEDGGVSTEAAKAAGYNYQTCKGTNEPVFKKQWVKRIKQGQFEAEKALKLPFKREVLDA